jgi:hypothetical protein
MYDSDGVLVHYPVQGQHINSSTRTKSQRKPLAHLIELCIPNETAAIAKMPYAMKKQGSLGGEKEHISPHSILLAFVKEQIEDAARTGNGTFSHRSSRQLQRLMTTCIDVAAKDLLHVVVEKFVSKHAQEEMKEEFMSPRGKTATATIITPSDSITVATGLPSVIVTGEVSEGGYDEEETLDDDASVSTKATADEFMSELKEEVLLQSLLHKRIHERKERVFQLQHRNGRRLLVVLPPDILSVASFEEEANKSNWVNVMLNTPERVEGMLLYLAKYQSDLYLKVGKQRKISMKTVTLTTTQTMALAKVAQLNDDRMEKLRSYLRTIGKVNLQLSKVEQQRIDTVVGLARTKQATFGTYLHEWTASKKAPEEVQYWNASLSNEIEAEIDLYLHHLLVESTIAEVFSFESLDYDTPGFDKKGITVLFGGDHGDGHCPISCKINLSSPSVRKEKKALAYQCPLIQFASVKCSKDAYELMQNTVMPKVKEQLLELKKSAVVTIYHRGNDGNVLFRSHMVPSTINMETLAFVPNGVTKMTFTYGDPQQPKFGFVVVDDERFASIPFYRLQACMIVSNFNELFIGDLAFLAMLVGMNNSAGILCLLCMH